MTKQEFQKLTEDHVLLLDGATGSNLMKAGMPRGVCTESWVLEHKDVIQSLQKAYIEAGSHIIYAPTFGGNRINLTMHGLEDQIEQINHTLAGYSKVFRCLYSIVCQIYDDHNSCCQQDTQKSADHTVFRYAWA